MWNRTDKLLLFIGGSCILFFLFMSLAHYITRQEHKESMELANRKIGKLEVLAEQHEIEISISSVMLSHHRERLEVLEAEVELLKHATDAENIRWAKIARVRDIIRKTMRVSSIPNGCTVKLNTHEIKVTAGALVDAAEERGVPLVLVVAMARQESKFYNCAISIAGARGVMQLMPRTAKIIARDIGRNLKINRIRDNVQMGVYYISEMLQEFDNNMELAVRAYNGGPTHVHRVISGERPNYYDETEGYWPFVQGYMKEYEKRGL